MPDIVIKTRAKNGRKRGAAKKRSAKRAAQRNTPYILFGTRVPRPPRTSRTRGPRIGRVPTTKLQKRPAYRHLLDASVDRVLGLPLPTSKYMVVRTTTVLSGVGKHCTLICPFRLNDGSQPEKWLHWVGVQDENSSLNIQAASNARPITVPMLDQFSLNTGNTEIVPAHITVRVFNSNAINTTSGTIYVGRCVSNLNLGNNTAQTWLSLFNNMVSTCNSQGLSAFQLAQGTYTANCIPNDMTEVQDFAESVVSTYNAPTFTWGNDTVRPGAFSPLFIFNPSGVALDYQIIAQWRVRLDANNPLSSSQTTIPTSSPDLWQRVIADGEAGLSAFERLVEVSERLPAGMSHFSV